jgi:pentatricopeptide repeat protein
LAGLCANGEFKAALGIFKESLKMNNVPGFIEMKAFVEGLVLGNSGKPVTLEMLGLTKFLRHVFQGQGTHDFRRPGTCEASDPRMYEVRGS